MSSHEEQINGGEDVCDNQREESACDGYTEGGEKDTNDNSFENESNENVGEGGSSSQKDKENMKENASGEEEEKKEEKAEEEGGQKKDGEKEDAKKSDKSDNVLKFFVGGIPPDCWESDVLKHFSAFGKVKEVQVIKEGNNGRNRGFCFVIMEDKSTYDAIFSAEHKIKNKKVDVRDMQLQNLSRKVFVGGINASFTEDALKEYFSKFGEVEKVTIMRDPEDRRSRGFGFVVFCDEESVKNTLKTKVHQISDEYKVEVRAAEARPRTSFKNSPASVSAYPPPAFQPPPMYGQWGRPSPPYMGSPGMYGGGGPGYYGGGMPPAYSPMAAGPRMGGMGMGGMGMGGPAMPPYAATPPAAMYNYGVPPYGPQRMSPMAARGRGTYRMGPY